MPSVCWLNLPGLRDEMRLVLSAEPLQTRRLYAVPTMPSGFLLRVRGGQGHLQLGLPWQPEDGALRLSAADVP